MIRSTIRGVISEVREHTLVIDVDGNGQAFIPMDTLPNTIKKKIKVGNSITITERKRTEDDTGEWIVKIHGPGEYRLTRKTQETP